MKIQYISDLHLEFKRDIDWSKKLIPAADILVIAGDLCYIHEFFSSKYIAKFTQYLRENWERVIYVPGNHEFYTSSFEKELEFYCYTQDEYTIAAQIPIRHINYQYNNISIINNDVITIDDVNFICTTLWSYIPPQHEFTLKRNLMDFCHIGKLNVSLFNSLNTQGCHVIETKLKELKDQKNVIITHHLPTWSVVSDPYRNDPVTHGYSNTRLDHLIDSNNILAWIHGHSHDAREDNINGVQIVRNPFGYAHDYNNGYQNNKVIEV